MTATTVEHVEPKHWRETVAGALARGARFASAWATRRTDGTTWHALLVSPGATCVLTTDVGAGKVDSIIDIVEAAAWDEREGHDLYGLEFDGHEPMRALVAHPEDSAAWTIPVTGDGVHEVAVGPIHAGVIESGHFRFHVVGERILAMDPRLFYKHRGLERAAEGHSADEALPFVGRACAACAVANTVAYAHAVENALGLWPDRELREQRTMLLELERLYNHLHDISAICAGVGFAPGSMAFAALKDRAQRINERAVGHRFLFGCVAVAKGTIELDQRAVNFALSELRDLRVDAAAAWRDLEFAGTMQARLDDVGVLAREDARRLGAVGPAARAAGERNDVRSASPRLWYWDFAPAVVAGSTGDVAARLRLRAAELETTCDILEDMLARPVRPGTATHEREPTEIGIGRVESPRGATTCSVELDQGRVARLHLRTGSYANWPALAHATAGNLLPDFPLINKSFELCYACVDR